MTQRSIDELRQLYAQKTAHADAWFVKCGLAAQLENLSTLIGNMKQAGCDIECSILGNASDQAFKLFKVASVIVPVTGVLKSGESQRLFAFCVENDSTPCMKLAISAFDITHQGVTGTIKDNQLVNLIRSQVFDLTEEKSWGEIEESLVNFAARNEAVLRHDVAGVFNASSQRPLSVKMRMAPASAAKKGTQP